ncbi:MAG TPA: 2OG-Fe(II) oxygenase [Beijerinckia sp.]|jgi:Rps23 Pro-64 3,4-dihydroxylase Tpa1-like proline 4-hydroxylase|nr:2OG-Fe(II) oxygenase [Beijerinckia sp.]
MSRSSLYAGLSERNHIVINGIELNLDALIDWERLIRSATKELSEKFKSNRPFPYVVIEDLFSPDLLELMYSEFDGIRWNDWIRYDNQNERKLGSHPDTEFGPATQLYFNTIYSKAFIQVIQQLSGLQGLVPDPELVAGGLHEIPEGGKLAVHLDFNKHPVTGLDNRLAFITYLNKDWKASYGGALELWDAGNDECQARIEPLFGRSVLFFQSSKSLHGHPDPVKTPDGRPRRSATAYFYSNGRTDGDSKPAHLTIIPSAAKLADHHRFMSGIKYFTPPALVDAVRRVKKLF